MHFAFWDSAILLDIQQIITIYLFVPRIAQNPFNELRSNLQRMFVVRVHKNNTLISRKIPLDEEFSRKIEFYMQFHITRKNFRRFWSKFLSNSNLNRKYYSKFQ